MTDTEKQPGEEPRAVASNTAEGMEHEQPSADAVQADGEAPVDAGEPPAKKPRTAPKFAPAELQVQLKSPQKGQLQRRVPGGPISAAGKPGNQPQTQPGAKGSSSMVTVAEASGPGVWGWGMRTVIEDCVALCQVGDCCH